MISRRAFLGISLCGVASVASAQQPRRDGLTPAPAANLQSAPEAPSSELKWGAANPARKAVPNAKPAITSTAQPPAAQPSGVKPASANAPQQPVARVTAAANGIRTDAGQTTLDYDISPYTARVTSTNRPEQAIIDWILRETGYEAWHSEIQTVLSADHRTLHVCHTPEIQKVVGDIVDRFVNTEAEQHVFGMRVITVGSPNWRTTAHRMLRSVQTQSPGIQAWLVAKEDAALLVAELRKRSDFQEHSTPYLMVPNGQSKIVSSLRTRNYVRDVSQQPGAPWGSQAYQQGQVNEGFNLEFSPLLSLDGRDVDAVIKCEVDQVEKMISVRIPMPNQVDRRNEAVIEVPQLITHRLHERFRWPADQVLLISLGVGPTPIPQAPNTLPLKIPYVTPGNRADLLVFVENKGKSTAQAGQPTAGQFRDRY